METIKVNMTPCDEVNTIHASQNDGEAREWGFELHNNGEKIDSSSITDQMVFKAYKGGTEQILPENGSVPVTAPFLGDIRYPQGLLTDQEFLYRESPTEEDGLAKITELKGNTLVWNQLVLDDAKSITQNGITCTRSQGGAFNLSGTATANFILSITGTLTATNGHKYLMLGGTSASNLMLQIAATWGGTNPTERGNGLIAEAKANGNYALIIFIANGTTVNESVTPIFVDLSAMFGVGNEPSIQGFRELFPLSYYSYNQGTLLSFNGNGIKTVGKNLFNSTLNTITVSGVTCTKNDDGSFAFNGTATTDGFFRLVDEYHFDAPSSVYISVVSSNNGLFANFGIDKYDNSIADTASASLGTDLLNNHPSNIQRVWVHTRNSTTYDNVKVYPMIRFATVSDGTYEPYTESTLSLPISTYFPTGMKSAGSVYDELTETKAITRIGEVDLGSLSWGYSSTAKRFYCIGFANNVKNNNANTLANALCGAYSNGIWNEVQGDTTKDKVFSISESNVLVRDLQYTTASAFKQAMIDQNAKLYYELATESETSFSTASLVTENAEIPLFNDDGVLIGKCSEQLSENPGFIDAKIKLSDSDGTCYSNKLQLHVERKP